LIGAAIDELRRLGHEVVDLGTHDASQPDDYPDYAVLVAEKVLNGECERFFVSAKYSQAERHLRRLAKVAAIRTLIPYPDDDLGRRALRRCG
jgi:ribose 5-phosphate isomerase RpiB